MEAQVFSWIFLRLVEDSSCFHWAHTLSSWWHFIELTSWKGKFWAENKPALKLIKSYFHICYCRIFYWNFSYTCFFRWKFFKSNEQKFYLIPIFYLNTCNTNTVLYCTDTVLYYTVLYCTVLYWYRTVLYCTANLKWGVIFKQTFLLTSLLPLG